MRNHQLGEFAYTYEMIQSISYVFTTNSYVFMQIFYDGRSDWYEVVPSCSFDSPFSNNEGCWAYVHVFIGHMCIPNLWWRKQLSTPGFLPGEPPWTLEPGKLQSIASERIKYNWTCMHMSSLEKCPFRSFAHFWLSCLLS